MPGRMEFELSFGQPGAPRSPKRGSDGPMRILVLGDFSGRWNRGPAEPVAGLADRPILGVDGDNFERLMARLSPRLRLDLAKGEKEPSAIEFRRMDDFHPDELYGRLEVFKPL
ncbi:MAG: type VI secretion system contractile sheath small subunit, partial [Chloroflexi bacterium]